MGRVDASHVDERTVLSLKGGQRSLNRTRILYILTVLIRIHILPFYDH